MVVVSVEIRFSLISIAGVVVSGMDLAVVARSARDDGFVDVAWRVVVVIVDVDVVVAVSVIGSIDEDKIVVVSIVGNSEDVVRMLVMVVSVGCLDWMIREPIAVPWAIVVVVVSSIEFVISVGCVLSSINEISDPTVEPRLELSSVSFLDVMTSIRSEVFSKAVESSADALIFSDILFESMN